MLRQDAAVSGRVVAAPQHFGCGNGGHVMTFRSWETGTGGLTITIKPLKTFIFRPILNLMEAGAHADVPLAEEGGVFSGRLSASQVAKLIASPTSAGAPFLFLTAHAVFKPGAPDRKWQWGIKMARDGGALPCFDKDGVPVPTAPDGFVLSALRSFPDAKAGGSETWIISLA